MTPHDHTRYIVAWLGSIAIVCIGAAAALIYKGFTQGELFVGIASAAAGSLGTMVAMRRNNQPGVSDPTTVQTTTIERKPPAAEETDGAKPDPLIQREP